MHVPTTVRLMRKSPLPADVGVLIRIAAGEDEALARAVETTGRSGREISAAAAFYIEQILLAPESDAYRMLGAATGATPVELRRNMALLMQWLHPDKNFSAERSVFASRVAAAWENLKTPERRLAYDGSIAADSHGEGQRGNGHRRHRRRVMSNAQRTELPEERRSGFLLETLRSMFRIGRS